ncbi:MoaD/ThiS family protein [Solihabitans fulvus]|uniref:MoaD/ThiS family protein n=1 Tax=Solihabitans fulvus TaxID=1892852 RepID=A0A5B2XGN7_9PSEU|nr:MoaD/ThiS family protein [Solihabitans fulvus]KAA2262947.1 MoaD/ThiS family protein [Solihabitans fulvus]
MARLTVRYFAGARAAAGRPEEPVELAGETTVAGVLDAVRARHGEGLARVLTSSSFLLDGVAVRDRGVAVLDGSLLDVLPPFAGG